MSCGPSQLNPISRKMLHRNPIFIRFCRSELRFKKAIFWYLLTLIVTAFTVAVVYGPQIAQGRDSVDAARAALLPILIIQGIILLFLGTGNVASGITREKVDNVLNYQRLTPLPIRQKIAGYLFGLPVRNYVMFLITVPFLFFVLIVGRVPVSSALPYYIIFFSSTLLYHFTGLVAGMISKRWRWSARISMLLIFMLYFVLPNFSHLGLVFLEFLTVRPAFTEHIVPIIGSNSGFQMQGLGLMFDQSVPFFTTEISGTVFSLIIQSGLVILFACIIARKWKADTVPSISKKMGIATFAVFAIMSLSNIWPNLTRADNALNIFQSNGAMAAEAAVSAIPLVMGLTTTFLLFTIMISALPDPMEYRHGRIRAKRLGLSHLSRWEDASSGYLFTTLSFLILGLMMVIAIYTMNTAGYYAEAGSSPMKAFWMLLAIGLSLYYFQGLKENFGAAKLAMFALLSWALPILAAILIMAIGQSEDLVGVTLLTAALSPIIIIPLSIIQMIPNEFLDTHGPEAVRAFGLSILLMSAMNAWLHWRLYQLRK